MTVEVEGSIGSAKVKGGGTACFVHARRVIEVKK
jgi:hypothetical protein